MDKKNNNDFFDIQDGTSDELLNFLNNSNTYFVEDKNTGVIGDKKTGIMVDKRTGKFFSDKKSGDLQYDFLDYKNSLNVLNNSDNIEDFFLEDSLESEEKVSLDSFEKEVTNNTEKIVNTDEYENIEQEKSLDSEEGSQLYNKIKISKKNINLRKYIDKKFKNKISDQENDLDESPVIDTMEQVESEISEPQNNSIDMSKQTDEEILNEINRKFNNAEGEFLSDKAIDNKEASSEPYGFSSFEQYEEKINKSNEEVKLDKEIEFQNDFEKFKMIMDFEDYLSNMSDEETILKSPFDEVAETIIPEVKVEEPESDGTFSPFDSLDDFEVEEIQTYDLESENPIEEGMFPEFDLNKSVSKKVSIREVIKSKQKKKQEQKELQEKIFFDTIEERIEQFKNFKEHSIDSQEILNAINVDLNRINSSIKVEFESLKNKRNSKKKTNKTEVPKDNKFSLQNLLEEISEDKAKGSSNENGDLSKKDKNNKILN